MIVFWAVAGLVAITPSCGSVTPVGALLMGVVAGAVCAWAVGLKYRFGYDDSLDVVGVHMVGGLVGTLGIGLIASAAAPTAVAGLFYGGGIRQLVVQLVIALAALLFTAVLTIVIAFIVKPLGWRISKEDEHTGIDETLHAETAYELS